MLCCSNPSLFLVFSRIYSRFLDRNIPLPWQRESGFTM